MVECTECGGDVPLSDNAVKGELLSCPDCGSELEVVSIDPPTLQKAPESEEDWGE